MEALLLYFGLGGGLLPLLAFGLAMGALVAGAKAVALAYRLLAEFIDEVSK